MYVLEVLVPLLLYGACCYDTAAYLAARLARLRRGYVAERYGLYLTLDVDAVEQGTRDFVHVALYLSWGADTVVGWIAIIAAGTRVHACHKHERTRIVDGVFGAADVDVPVFQRLAQHLEGRLVELGQLVAEEHAIVCQRDFARLRSCSSTY